MNGTHDNDKNASGRTMQRPSTTFNHPPSLAYTVRARPFNRTYYWPTTPTNNEPSHPNGFNGINSANATHDTNVAGIYPSYNTMPKNYLQPLTCFYWYNFGHCNKSDDECLYAHYPTGIVASAPISLRGSKNPVAGRNAMKQLDDQAEREKRLREWETSLKAKEKELNEKAKNPFGGPLKHAEQVISNGKLAVSLAHSSLTSMYKDVAKASETDDTETSVLAANALDSAIATLGSFEADLVKLEKELLTLGMKLSDSSDATSAHDSSAA